MPEATTIDLGQSARRLRLDTLVRLRWLAVAGQSIALLVTYIGFGFTLPIGPSFLAVAVSAWLNIGLRLRYPVNHRLNDGPASILLAYDILQLSALLYLTGGLQNPFALLFLAPVMISAVSLSRQRTMALVGLMICSASLLVFYHWPLPWRPGETIELPFLFVAGIWLALVLGAGFIAIYAARVAEEARLLSDALAATELVLAREQHLTQLDGLAAAAAHELGTPLATITLVVKEIAHQIPKSGPLSDDIALITQEVSRCRAILAKLKSLGDESGDMWNATKIKVLLEEVVEPVRDFGVDVKVRTQGEPPEPVCSRNPGILYGLGNLVENAVDFAREAVVIDARWSRDEVRILIEDDGPGFAPDILNRLGEPYVTTRLNRRAKSEEGSGLGLGFFVAKTLLERSGATITISNRTQPANGASILIRWPRREFERHVDAGASPAAENSSITA